MGKKIHHCKGLVCVPSKLFSEFVVETETMLRPSISLSSYKDATVYPLHTWNVLLNLTVYFKAIEQNCFKQSLSFFGRTFGNFETKLFLGKQRFKMEVAE